MRIRINWLVIFVALAIGLISNSIIINSAILSGTIPQPVNAQSDFEWQFLSGDGDPSPQNIVLANAQGCKNTKINSCNQYDANLRYLGGPPYVFKVIKDFIGNASDNVQRPGDKLTLSSTDSSILLDKNGSAVVKGIRNIDLFLNTVGSAPKSTNPGDPRFNWVNANTIEAKDGKIYKKLIDASGKPYWQYSYGGDSLGNGACQDWIFPDSSNAKFSDSGKITIQVSADSADQAIANAKYIYNAESIDDQLGTPKKQGCGWAFTGIKIAIGNSDELNDPSSAKPTDTEDKVECESSDVLSWILCPVVTTLAEGANNLANDFVIPLLKVNPLDANSNLYDVWKSFRTLANIFFVLVFFVIIFSTAINNRE